MLKEIRNIVDGKYKDYEEIVRKRKEDGLLLFDHSISQRPAADFRKQVHGVIFVFKSTDPSLKSGKYFEQYQPFRRFMKSRGMQPLVCITWADKLEALPESDREHLRHMAIAATGCDKDRMYQIQNATTAKDIITNATKSTIFEMLYMCLVFSERYQLARENRILNKLPLEPEEQEEKKEEPKPTGASTGKGITVRVYAGKDLIGSYPVPAGSDMTFRMLKETIRERRQALPANIYFRDQDAQDVVDGAKIIQQYDSRKDVDLYVQVP